MACFPAILQLMLSFHALKLVPFVDVTDARSQGVPLAVGSGRTASRASRPQQRLDRAAFIHCAVALGHLSERQRQVEDLSGVDLSVQTQILPRHADCRTR